MTKEAVQPFNDLAKFTLLSICLSSFLSYVIFIIALIKHYYKDHWNRFHNCKINWSRAYDELESQLHPFNNNDDDGGRHTKLNGNRRHCFCIFLWLNLIILLLIFIVFIIGQYALHEPPKPIEMNNKRTIIIEWIEGITAIAYFYSHLCTITSCFIFSKLMYGIQRKIINQETRNNEIITEVNNNIGNSDNSSEHRQRNITDAGTNSINLEHISSMVDQIPLMAVNTASMVVQISSTMVQTLSKVEQITLMVAQTLSGMEQLPLMVAQILSMVEHLSLMVAQILSIVEQLISLMVAQIHVL